jgi:bifunctional non-homologous end joining protein LigD
VPSGRRWIHEIKFDGYRTQAQLKAGVAKTYTRSGYDWTRRFRPIAQALTRLPVNDLVLDGEMIVADASGVPDFAALHADLAAGRKDRLVYYAFDLLYLDGIDLRAAPLIERKRLLASILAGAPSAGPIVFSDHFEEQGEAMFSRACAMRLEGIVSKLRDAPYRSGRSESWIKVKCVKRDAFPIVAFVEKLGARPRKIASLYVGRREGERLLYAGKARSGYTETIARERRERLDPLIVKKSPLAIAVRKPKATWVEPVVDAEIEYSGVTEDGILREAVFKGIRVGSDAPETVPMPPRKAQRTPRPPLTRRSRAGVPPENILQLLPDAVVPSKEQLREYWRRIGSVALRYVGRRPLKLVRHTRGTTFYHRGPLPPVPLAVHQLRTVKREGGEGVRLWVDSIEGLLGLVEIGVVEIHPWNAVVDDTEHPDTVVWDLDPGRDVPWDFVREAALSLKELLRRERLDSWPKVTGGSGLHVIAPASAGMNHHDARNYAREIAERLAATKPDKYWTKRSPPPKRLFIDYLRNGRGTTAIGAYSPRARKGFPIAAPVTWAEVEKGIRSDAITMQTAEKSAATRRTAGHGRT